MIARSPGRAQQVCFVAASVHAALVVPLSLAAGSSLPFALEAYAPPVGHARELLGGFVLAVVTGYLLGRPSRGLFGVLCAPWLAARFGWLLDAGGPWALASQGAFALAFTASLAPKFIGSGRRWRNLAIAPLLALLAAASVALDGITGNLALVHQVMLLLLAILLAFMGGRVLAPAVTTQRERDGHSPAVRMQPRLEGTIMALLAAAATALAAGLASIAGAATLAAGAVSAIRLWRWRIWTCRARTDLWCLGAGHLWLSLGLLAFGLDLARGSGTSAALHLLTVGALGTFTFNIMLRARLQRTQGEPARESLLPAGTVLLAVATLARYAATPSGMGHAPILIGAAAAAWTVAYVALARRLLRA